jgi:hypothetical protein
MLKKSRAMMRGFFYGHLRRVALSYRVDQNARHCTTAAAGASVVRFNELERKKKAPATAEA